MIVGVPPNQRGVACAVSYEARKLGVCSAMPMITAKRLCSDDCFVRPRMVAYRDEPERIMQIIASMAASWSRSGLLARGPVVTRFVRLGTMTDDELDELFRVSDLLGDGVATAEV